jgi:hypothetical protein
LNSIRTRAAGKTCGSFIIEMSRYSTPPGSPPLISAIQISSPSPRRMHSRRKTSDSVIDQWATLAKTVTEDEPISDTKARGVLADQIISTLRTDLLKEIERTDWMYNDHSYT